MDPQRDKLPRRARCAGEWPKPDAADNAWLKTVMLVLGRQGPSAICQEVYHATSILSIVIFFLTYRCVVLQFAGMGTKTALPTKRLNKYTGSVSNGAFLPEVIQELIKSNGIKDYIKGSAPQERQRVCAFLTTFNPHKVVAEMCGVALSYVKQAVHRHKDIVQSATMGRNMTVAGLAESKAIELLVGMDTSKIDHAKKPQAIKYLVDSADIANQHLVQRKENQPEDTMELVFRIRKRMTQPAQSGDIVDVQEVEPEQAKELNP